MRLKSILTLAALTLFGSLSAQINLAGTYEGEMNDNITRKRMYANLDFINGVPDFTQIFTAKEAPLKILPKDFMNAKKLKKNFAGQTAPGFIRYNSKTIFSDTEEIKLTNPRLENGVLFADWVNHDGKQGKCVIIANNDNTIQILGLTTLDTDFGPDNLILTRTESKLPEGAQPYVTTPDAKGLANKRYCREILWKVKVDNSKGLSGVKANLDVNQVRRIGNDILIPVQFTNSASKEARPDFGAHNPFDRNELASAAGNSFNVVSVDAKLDKVIPPKETVVKRLAVLGVPLDAQKLDYVKVQGRAVYSHATEKNPYGSYDYKLSDIVIPELRPSNYNATFITDTDLQVNIDGLENEGKNIVVSFTLTNHSNREKRLSANDKGIARTTDGEEYDCIVKLPATLGPNDVAKGKMIITDAAGANIRNARIQISVEERNLDYRVLLQIG